MACSRRSTLDQFGERFTFNRQSSDDNLGDPYAAFLLETQLAEGESVQTLADAWGPWIEWSASMGRSFGEVDQ